MLLVFKHFCYVCCKCVYSEGVTNMNSICLNTQKRCRWEKKKSFIFTNAIKNPGFLCVCVCKTTIETTTFGYNLFFNLFQHRQKRGQWPRQNMYIVFFICSISEDIQLLSKYQLHRSDFFFFFKYDSFKLCTGNILMARKTPPHPIFTNN